MIHRFLIPLFLATAVAVAGVEVKPEWSGARISDPRGQRHSMPLKLARTIWLATSVAPRKVSGTDCRWPRGSETRSPTASFRLGEDRPHRHPGAALRDHGTYISTAQALRALALCGEVPTLAPRLDPPEN